MARPILDIDADKVKQLAGYGLSYQEIAAVLDCSHDTLERRFASELKQGHEKRNGSLRRRQYELAMDGNATMLIWLGKQYLGQSDKVETSTSERPTLTYGNMPRAFPAADAGGTGKPN